jgi:hypothetical protein
MGVTEELFVKLKQKQKQNKFTKDKIIFCTLEPKTVTKALKYK